MPKKSVFLREQTPPTPASLSLALVSLIFPFLLERVDNSRSTFAPVGLLRCALRRGPFLLRPSLRSKGCKVLGSHRTRRIANNVTNQQIDNAHLELDRAFCALRKLVPGVDDERAVAIPGALESANVLPTGVVHQSFEVDNIRLNELIDPSLDVVCSLCVVLAQRGLEQRLSSLIVVFRCVLVLLF